MAVGAFWMCADKIFTYNAEFAASSCLSEDRFYPIAAVFSVVILYLTFIKYGGHLVFVFGKMIYHRRTVIIKGDRDIVVVIIVGKVCVQMFIADIKAACARFLKHKGCVDHRSICVFFLQNIVNIYTLLDIFPASDGVECKICAACHTAQQRYHQKQQSDRFSFHHTILLQTCVYSYSIILPEKIKCLYTNSRVFECRNLFKALQCKSSDRDSTLRCKYGTE